MYLRSFSFVFYLFLTVPYNNLLLVVKFLTIIGNYNELEVFRKLNIFSITSYVYGFLLKGCWIIVCQKLQRNYSSNDNSTED